MPYKPGFEEDGFLRTLAPFEPSQIELKAENCTKVSDVQKLFIKSLFLLITLITTQLSQYSQCTKTVNIIQPAGVS